MRKHTNNKLVTTKTRTNYLVSKPNYYTTKFFTEYLLAIEMKKPEILSNKPVYLGLLRLELSQISKYKFWYDYVKSKYDKKEMFWYMDTNIFWHDLTVYIKTDDIYKDIAEGVKTRFNTSNYELECNSIARPLPKGKTKKVIGLMNDQFGQNKW